MLSEVEYIADVIKCFILSSIAYILLYAGFAFINGRLFEGFLGGFYDHSGYFIRMLVFLALAALPANFLLAKTFDFADASIAGPVILIVVVLITVLNSLVLDGARMTTPLFLATCLAVFSCALVSWLLTTQK